MLGGMLAHRARWLRNGLALWFAALLAMAPAAGPSLPVDPAVVPASLESFDFRDQALAQAREPASGVRPAQAALGTSLRLSLVEPTPGLPPLKPPPDWLEVANELLVTPKRIAASAVNDLTDAFHRSSVGTARTPTGPPS